MSVQAMVSCWGPGFPSADPFHRLLALALADSTGSGDGAEGEGIILSRSLVVAVARKLDVDNARVATGLNELVEVGVLVNRGLDVAWGTW